MEIAALAAVSASAAAAAAPAAAVTAAGGAAATAAAGAGLASSASILAGGLTIFSAGAALLGGLQMRQAANAEAKMQRFQAQSEIERGKEQAAEIRMRLARTLAEGVAAGGAAGLDLRGDSIATVQKFSTREAGGDIEAVKRNAGQRAIGLRMGAKQTRLKGRAALLQGATAASGSLFDFATSRRALGAPATAGG